jgi:hypothetical protein
MRYEAREIPWPKIAAQATAYALAHQLDVLIIDTLDKWMPLVGEGAENDTGTTVRNLLPLMDAASAGLAIVIVTHRKGEGRHGERVRGTTALTGAADVIIELERARGVFGEEGGRVLFGTSRFQSTPETLALTLSDGGVFVAVGSAEEAETQMQQASILAVVRAAGRPLTRDEISEALTESGDSIRNETLVKRLAEMRARAILVRSGGGKRGDPYQLGTR